MRAHEDADARASKSHMTSVMTARQLLSILRLSQALARVRFADSVAVVRRALFLAHACVRVCVWGGA